MLQYAIIVTESGNECHVHAQMPPNNSQHAIHTIQFDAVSKKFAKRCGSGGFLERHWISLPLQMLVCVQEPECLRFFYAFNRQQTLVQPEMSTHEG